MICNDAFGKNLYPLRDIVLKINVTRADDKKLHERIDDILQSEKILGIFSDSIKSIIQQSDGDARNCINRIQFLAQGKQEQNRKCDDDKSEDEAVTLDDERDKRLNESKR